MVSELTEAPPTSLAALDALSSLEAAVASMKSAELLHDADAITRADEGLRRAIDAARAAGIAWGIIGDRLGIARGNAYQRYRRRQG